MGRVGSGQEVFRSHESGRVALARPDPTSAARFDGPGFNSDHAVVEFPIFSEQVRAPTSTWQLWLVVLDTTRVKKKVA